MERLGGKRKIYELTHQQGTPLQHSPEKRKCVRAPKSQDIQPQQLPQQLPQQPAQVLQSQAPQLITQVLQPSAVDLEQVGRLGITRFRYLLHNSTIWELRNAMIDVIKRLLRKNRPNALQEWVDRMAFRLDEELFKKFPNLNEYSNPTTLISRIKQLYSAMMLRSTNTPISDSSSGGGGSSSGGGSGGSSSRGGSSSIGGSTEIGSIYQMIQDLEDFHLDGGSTQERLGENAQEGLTDPKEEESEDSDEEEGDY